MIDSCVFFKMIEYNNFVMKYGKENLDDFIKHNEINLLEDKNIIIELISRLTGDKFFVQNEDLNFTDLIIKFSNERITDLIGRYNKEIKGLIVAINNPNVPGSKKDLLKIKISQIKNALRELKEIDKLIINYKLKEQSINYGNYMCPTKKSSMLKIIRQDNKNLNFNKEFEMQL